MTHEQTGGLENAAYVLAAAIFVSSLMVSASVYVSLNGVADVIAAKDLQIALAGAGAGTGSGSQPGAAPSPSPAPSPVQPSAPSAANIPSSMLAGSPVKGPANAKVTIVEFSDFQCPYCQRALPILSAVMGKYPNDVKLVYKHFPLNSIHPNAQKAAEASECAKDQNKFWELHDWMFANQGSLDVASLKAAAQSLSMNVEVFNACLDGGSKAPIVNKDLQDGSSLGVQGTPTFFVNGRQVVGADSVGLNAAVDAEVAG